MPSKCESSAHVDYVPALCTHRPSLSGTELIREEWGLWLRGLTTSLLREPFLSRWFEPGKSRNKVAVGEPAAGSSPSFARDFPHLFRCASRRDLLLGRGSCIEILTFQLRCRSKGVTDGCSFGA
ncbi:hypothetical protein B9Z55_028763 [Caenorhabditis nigoni]|uniref:Uncharacterized protein n=1 Tax=Caenorhabditis nigoni TaxID=1611254 RepID=A0A2G5SA50_9PELO|nr:hypothetical protein B9Z55_028763 [Caenorhabditis nigoni]